MTWLYFDDIMGITKDKAAPGLSRLRQLSCAVVRLLALNVLPMFCTWSLQALIKSAPVIFLRGLRGDKPVIEKFYPRSSKKEAMLKAAYTK